MMGFGDGSGVSWTIYTSLRTDNQIYTPTPRHSFFYRPDALPDTKTNGVNALKAKAAYSSSFETCNCLYG